MDALTALLRHIKLEPLIGTGTPTQNASKPLTEAPIPPAGPSAAAEGHADATLPNPGSTAGARTAAAQNSAAQTRLAIAAEKSFVQNANTEANTGDASSYTRLSPDASLLSKTIIAAQNSAAPMPTLLGLDVASDVPAQVAQRLNTSLTQSGLFYESHLQEWAAGDRSLDSLHSEPHNRLPSNTAANPLLRAVAADVPADRIVGAPDEMLAATTANQTTLPEALQPVVREQLNALDMQRVLWHGEVWPQQQAELEIAAERHARDQDSETPQLWHSTLRIDLPGLGTVIAQVMLDDEGARVSLRAAPEAIAALRQGGEEFRGAMEAAGIALRQLELSGTDNPDAELADTGGKHG